MLKELLYVGNKEKKRNYKDKPITIKKNGNRNIHIDNYLKCEWIKCCNQKTQAR